MRHTRVLLALLALTGCGTDLAAPADTFLACAFTDPRRLEPGEVLQVRGEEHQGVCLTGDQAAQYLYVPFHAAAASSGPDEPRAALTVEIMGGGLAGAAATVGDSHGGLNGSSRLHVAPRLPQDPEFHATLRRWEVEGRGGRLARELNGRPSHSDSPVEPRGDPRQVLARTVPEPGALRDLNVSTACDHPDLRTGRVRYVSDHAIIVTDTANPADLHPGDYASFAATFDTLVHPVLTRHFGEPSDIDGNGRAILFFTRAVNELTNPGAATFTAGFFWSGDLFPAEATDRAEACPAGNRAEIFYMLAPDPFGEVGIAFTLDQIRDMAMPVIAHEYQHLINSSRRLWVNEASEFERPWLNEGLSHIAEELVFYEAAGLEPRQNLDVPAIRAAPTGVESFNRYMGSNFSNLGGYMARPDTASLMGIDDLATRGATWSFLRYAADRSGQGDQQFFRTVANSTASGLDNLDRVLGASALGWMQDWTVSVFTDDRVSALPEAFSQPSWALRQIYTEVIGRYPLDVRALGPGTTRFDLLPGGAAYPIFSLAPGGRAAVHVQGADRSAPGALRGSFVRIQ